MIVGTAGLTLGIACFAALAESWFRARILGDGRLSTALTLALLLPFSYVPLIRESVTRLGFRFKDVKILLSSHAHSDHVAGHRAVQEQSGARIISMAVARRIEASAVKTFGT